MPIFVDYWMLYYNKELFDAKGVAYPKTMDEIVTVAARSCTIPPRASPASSRAG